MSESKFESKSDSKVVIISADCHAGALPATYNEYLPRQYRDAANAWWLAHAREMMSRAGTFFDQEAVEAYAEKAGEGGQRMKAMSDPGVQLSDDQIMQMLCDEQSPFAPRRASSIRRCAYRNSMATESRARSSFRRWRPSARA